ncbi:MAG: serine/threonine-protein kinase [Caldimonas sp.]
MAALADRDARNVFFACPRRVDGPQRAEAMIRESVIDWQELSRLYEHADALDPAGLAAWLAQLRSDKHRLLSQLERMLEARAQIASGTFLEALPKIDVAPQVLESEWAEGSRIGAYRLVRHIGSGGMAEVWLAERADGAFARQVAIKLLFNHPTRAQRETFVERFRRERDILASLHHPNIAGLHDAGVTPSGQPWLALEYVQGEPITAWCDARKLGVVDRVRLFCQVLLAVEAAHASLVIHRDIKPSNVLVNEAGEVKLLDFGIAKLLDVEDSARDDTELTRQGGRPLTLQYASPEQIAGRPLTTATDVFSLGLVLYELLSGTRPYDVSALSAAQLENFMLDRLPCRLGKAAVSEPAATARRATPKALGRVLAGDLDAIVAKSLGALPPRRYSTVDAMRQDLVRWTENRPVSAKRASPLYGLLKFWARHRLGVSLATASVISLAGVSVVAVVLEERATKESARAVAAREFLFKMFREVDEPESGRGSELTAIQVLQSGRNKALTELADQPDLQGEVLSEIGRMQQAVGDYKLADKTFGEVVELRRKRGSPTPLAGAYVDWALNANQLGEPARALSLIGEAERISSAVQDDGLRSNLLFVKGLAADSSGDLRASSRYLEQALPLARKSLGDDAALSIKILRSLADVESEMGRHQVALLRIQDAFQRAVRAKLGAKTLLLIQYEEANIENNAGRYASLPQHLAALEGDCERLLGSDEERCVVISNLRALILLRVGDRAGAMAVLPRLLRAGDNDASPRRQLQSLVSATRVLAANGQLSSHAGIRDRLIELSQKSSQPVDERAYALIAVAESFLFQGDPNEAAKWGAAALAVVRESPVALPIVSARAKLLEGLASQALANDAIALARLRNAADELGAAMGVSHPVVQVFRLNQVLSLLRTSGRKEATMILDGALPLIEEGFGDSAPLVQRAKKLQRTMREGGGSGPLASVSDFLT